MTNPRIIKLYRWTMWNIASRLFVHFWLKPRYNFVRSDGSDPLPKPPFVIVANHGTFFDPWIIGYFSRHPVSFMCNDDAFRGNAMTRWYLNSIGAFPKKKGASDFRAMKRTMSLLGEGYPVCIFPEGQTSWDGETQLLYKGIEKIVRHGRVPLVMVRISGNFLTKPWWANSTRKGRIECLFKVITPDRIQSISENELFLAIKTFIAHNDIKAHASAVPAFRGKGVAEGLQRFVWMCMNCDSEGALIMQADTVRCAACSASWTIDALCKLSPLKNGIRSFADLHDWAQWHKIKVRSRIAAAAPLDVLATERRVQMLSLSKDASFTDQGTGELILTKDNLSFTRTRDRSSRVFPVAEIDECMIQRADVVEITQGASLNRFAFHGQSPMKWVYYLRYLKGYDSCERQGYIG